MTAAQSDPVALGWMVGAPPPEDKIIRASDADAFDFPKSRWSFSHFRQLMPTLNVSRGLGVPRLLQRRIDADIDAVRFSPLGGGAAMRWDEAFEANYCDGVVVLHDGVLVHERYGGALTALGQHGAMSVTKSLTGLLGEMLVAEGALDPEARVARLVPELAQGGFADASVRQVLDMTTGLDFNEDYADPKADIWAYSAAGRDSFYRALQNVRRGGPHGEAFGYRTVNSDALGWLIARVTGSHVATLLSERIWSRIGAEQDACYTVDSTGAPFAGGGFNAGLRDLARLGQLLLDDGMVDGQQLVPKAAVASIRGGGDRAAFAKAGYKLLEGWSYRGMFWVTHNANGAYMARGVYGQALYVDPTARMVIARFSSHPTASNSANDPTSLPAYAAVADYLIRRG